MHIASHHSQYFSIYFVATIHTHIFCYKIIKHQSSTFHSTLLFYIYTIFVCCSKTVNVYYTYSMAFLLGGWNIGDWEHTTCPPLFYNSRITIKFGDLSFFKIENTQKIIFYNRKSNRIVYLRLILYLFFENYENSTTPWNGKYRRDTPILTWWISERNQLYWKWGINQKQKTTKIREKSN